MQRTEQTPMRVKRYVIRLARGGPFPSNQLQSLGNPVAVRQALHRLTKAGELVRVTRGIYARPEYSKNTEGPVLPAPEKVAAIIAKTHGAKLEVNGAEAARMFNLSTQMPMGPVFQTTGPSRIFHMGKLIVKLQHVTPRKLALSGPSRKALVALWYVGKHETTPQVIEQIRQNLSPREFARLENARRVMPAWMASAFAEHARGGHHG